MMRDNMTNQRGPAWSEGDPPFQRYGKQVRHMGIHFCDAVDEVASILIEQALNRDAALARCHQGEQAPV